MGKLLRVVDYVLLAAAVGGEAFENIRLVGGIAPNLVKARYGFVPPNFKKKSYLSSVSRLLSTGDIERKVDLKGGVCLELTSSGNKRFKRKFPIISLQKGKWDGKFMIVSFDISEKERYVRDMFRAKLKDLGFGQMQKSVWISPFHFEEDIKEFIESKNLGKLAIVMKAETLMVGDMREFADRVWHTMNLNEKYSEILSTINSLKGESVERIKVKTKEIWENYLELLQEEPFLPDEFLPADWFGRKVGFEISKLALQKTPRSTV